MKAIKDTAVILHLQGILQEILKNPDNFKQDLEAKEMKAIKSVKEDVGNTMVVAHFASENFQLHLKLLERFGEKIPPATQEIISEAEEFARRSRYAA